MSHGEIASAPAHETGRLAGTGVDEMPGYVATRVTSEGVEVASPSGGAEFIEAATIVWADASE